MNMDKLNKGKRDETIKKFNWK